jgi:methylated-DNA-protein-cysteine methyltransferase related protein
MSSKGTKPNFFQGPSKYEVIWETVCRIPRGKVATYGGIATLSGFAGQARLVGYALHNLPRNIDVPWHRVINSQGRISLPKAGGHYDRQRKLLEDERVVLQGEKIDLGRYGWRRILRANHDR